MTHTSLALGVANHGTPGCVGISDRSEIAWALVAPPILHVTRQGTHHARVRKAYHTHVRVVVRERSLELSSSGQLCERSPGMRALKTRRA